MKKVCFKCGNEKPLSDFYKHKGMLDGHLNKCKDCSRNDARVNLEKVGGKYDQTEKGVIRVIYKTQKRHNTLRGHGEIPYSKEEFSTWLYANGFEELYNKWKASGFNSDIKPSVDRINDFNGYAFDNIRLVTWRMNRNHQIEDILLGKGTGWRRCKPVIKYDINKNVVCEYVSYSSAVRNCGYSIEYQLRTGAKCRNGFYWAYK